MQYNDINQVYFSPTGTTKKVVQEIIQYFDLKSSRYDLLRKPPKTIETFASDSLVVVGVPVYSGRIPAICVDMLEKLKGTNTPAIVVVVYGNRDYDDALLELTDTLKDNGFLIVGAAAFIAQHSIFPSVAKARPDQDDLLKISAFSEQCKEKLAQMTGEESSVFVKGNFPYLNPAPVPLRPSASKQCTACGACAQICPTGAISQDNPRIKDCDLCISCAACIAICPQKAQAFRGIPHKLFGPLFWLKCRNRREPEVFV